MSDPVLLIEASEFARRLPKFLRFRSFLIVALGLLVFGFGAVQQLLGGGSDVVAWLALMACGLCLAGGWWVLVLSRRADENLRSPVGRLDERGIEALRLPHSRSVVHMDWEEVASVRIRTVSDYSWVDSWLRKTRRDRSVRFERRDGPPITFMRETIDTPLEEIVSSASAYLPPSVLREGHDRAE